MRSTKHSIMEHIHQGWDLIHRCLLWSCLLSLEITFQACLSPVLTWKAQWFSLRQTWPVMLWVEFEFQEREVRGWKRRPRMASEPGLNTNYLIVRIQPSVAKLTDTHKCVPSLSFSVKDLCPWQNHLTKSPSTKGRLGPRVATFLEKKVSAGMHEMLSFLLFGKLRICLWTKMFICS